MEDVYCYECELYLSHLRIGGKSSIFKIWELTLDVAIGLANCEVDCDSHETGGPRT